MTVDRGQIDAQLKSIGEGDRWWEQREFRALPAVLEEGERITGLAMGKLRGTRMPRMRPSGRWLFVTTDRRVICLQEQRYARRQIDLPGEQILRVSQSSGLRRYRVTLHLRDRRVQLRIAKSEAYRFGDAVAAFDPPEHATPLPPELEPLALIPGMNRIARLPMVRSLAERVSQLSPADTIPADRVRKLERAVESLTEEVDQLREQVAFLEDLLKERDSGVLPVQAGGD